MEPILRAKVKIFSKVKIKKNAFDKRWWAYKVYIRQKNLGGCHHLILVYDASKLITVYVVIWPVLGLQTSEGIFSEKLRFLSKVKI